MILRRSLHGRVLEMRLRRSGSVYRGRESYLLPWNCRGRSYTDATAWTNRFHIRVTRWRRRSDDTRVAVRFRARLYSVGEPTRRRPAACPERALLISKAVGRRI